MGGNHSHSSQKPSSSRGPQHRQQQAQSKKKSQEQKSQRQKDRQGKSKESKQQSQRSEQKRQVLPEKISSGSEENFLSLPNDFSPQPPSLSLPEEPQCFDPSPPDSRCFIPLPQQQQHYLPSQQDEYIYRQFHQPVHYPQIGVPSQSLSVQDVMEGAEGFIQLVRLGWSRFTGQPTREEIEEKQVWEERRQQDLAREQRDREHLEFLERCREHKREEDEGNWRKSLEYEQCKVEINYMTKEDELSKCVRTVLRIQDDELRRMWRHCEDGAMKYLKIHEECEVLSFWCHSVGLCSIASAFLLQLLYNKNPTSSSAWVTPVLLFSSGFWFLLPKQFHYSSFIQNGGSNEYFPHFPHSVYVENWEKKIANDLSAIRCKLQLYHDHGWSDMQRGLPIYKSKKYLSVDCADIVIVPELKTHGNRMNAAELFSHRIVSRESHKKFPFRTVIINAIMLAYKADGVPRKEIDFIPEGLADVQIFRLKKVHSQEKEMYPKLCVVAESLVMDGYRQIIVAFPGTARFEDWMTNLKIGTSVLFVNGGHGVYGHGGFITVLKHNANDIMRHILRKYGDRLVTENMQILVTGHSLGGALAQVFALLCQSWLRQRSISQKLDFRRLIVVITLGQPAVWSSKRIYSERTKQRQLRSSHYVINSLSAENILRVITKTTELKADPVYMLSSIGSGLPMVLSPFLYGFAHFEHSPVSPEVFLRLRRQIKGIPHFMEHYQEAMYSEP
jgi:hypothetical protein